MIPDSDISVVGKIVKTHGVDGELSVTFFVPSVFESLDADSCLIMSIDGINVPFFVDGVRSRGAESLLVHLDGVDSQQQAAQYVGLNVSMLTRDIPAEEVDDDDEPQGMYAAQLIGFAAIDADGNRLGIIDDIDDSTDNPLFIITKADGGKLLIPIVDEFIDEISAADRRITFDLPDGLLDI